MGAMRAPVGVILAGGMARRMGGGDKGLRLLGRGTVLGHIVGRTLPQVAALALNANSDPARFAALGLPVVADGAGADMGPLAGILAALVWGAAQGADTVLTVPGDTPFLPGDLVPQLLLAAEGRSAALAQSGGRLHPLCALWHVDLRGELAAALAAGTRKVTDWALPLEPGIADFPLTMPDGFFNVNTPDDLAQAERWL